MIIDGKNRELEDKMAKYKVLESKIQNITSALDKYRQKMLQYETKPTAVRTAHSSAPLQLKQLGGNASRIHQLNPVDLLLLEKISTHRSNDREFVEVALRMMYKENMQELRNRVLKISTKCAEHAKVISPTKLSRIYLLMKERINKVAEPTEKLDRMKTAYIHKLISKSIFRVKKY